MPPSPTAADLRGLAAKYRRLSALGAETSKDDLRAVANEFPGALRELDTLGAPELTRRADATESAAAGGPLEPWMAWIWAYHRLMRATLALKRSLGRRRPLAADLDRLAAQATELAGFPLDGPFVHAVVRPPQRRLAVVVLERLAALYGIPATTIATALFPIRRPSPYTLR